MPLRKILFISRSFPSTLMTAKTTKETTKKKTSSKKTDDKASESKKIPGIRIRLSAFDHRVLDGGAAGRLLARVAALLQSPDRL